MDLWQWHCRDRREKKLQLVCGNAIAENGRKTKNSGRNLERNFFKKNATSTIFSQQITGD